MKKSRIKTSLLVSAASVTGLALGAGIALAAHPPIQLYTYEEVAQQMGFPAAPVIVDKTTKQGLPYSPKQTCFGSKDGGATKCHGDDPANPKLKANYNDLAEHAFHAELGFGQWMDNSASGRLVNAGVQTGLALNKPWVQSHGHNGKW
ncbi:MAG: cytochrome C [Geobacteraceae bacterium]|nr:cytochrome C [Geobacteraceae bacterium]